METAMNDEEVREWVRGRLTFEAWLRALHAARDESAAAEELLSSDQRRTQAESGDRPNHGPAKRAA
jgi:hypothetical protein